MDRPLNIHICMLKNMCIYTHAEHMQLFSAVTCYMLYLCGFVDASLC